MSCTSRPGPDRTSVPSCSDASRPSPSGGRWRAASLDTPCARRPQHPAVGARESLRRGRTGERGDKRRKTKWGVCGSLCAWLHKPSYKDKPSAALKKRRPWRPLRATAQQICGRDGSKPPAGSNQSKGGGPRMGAGLGRRERNGGRQHPLRALGHPHETARRQRMPLKER